MADYIGSQPEETRRDKDPMRSLCVPRRALFAGLGLIACGIAAEPILGPETAWAAEASTWPASHGDFGDHNASGTKWWTSNRGEYMYCIDETNHRIATTGSSGTPKDISSVLTNNRIRRAVEFIIAKGPKNSSDEQRSVYGQPPSGKWGEWWRNRLLCQWAIWLVTRCGVDVGYSSWNYSAVIGHSRDWLIQKSYDGIVDSLEWYLSEACSYAKGSSEEYTGYVKAWQGYDGSQPVAYYNRVYTADLWFGVTPAANNGHALADGVYRIRSAYNESYCLDANSDSVMGVQLKLYSDAETNNQLFHLKCVDSWNLFEIRPLNSLALTYDVENAGGSGSKVMKWYQNSKPSANQRFYLEHSDNGSWCIVPSHSVETALDLETYSVQNNTKVITWSRTRQSNGYGTTSQSQRWYLERVDTNTKGPAAGTVESYSKGFSGGVYAIYENENLDVELGRFNLREDGWGLFSGPWSKINENYYVHMVSCPSGYRFDNMTYRFNVEQSLIEKGGRPWMTTSLEPTVVTVRFHVVDLDGTTHLVHSTEFVLGTKVGPESTCVADADAKAREAYPEEYEYLRKWYLDIGMGKRLTEATVVTADLNLFARRPARLAFVWLGSDGRTWNLCHQAYRKWGMELAPGDETVTAADEALAAALDVETLDLTPRWFTDEACRTPLAASRIKANMTLRATPSWGWVSHYVDGTGNEALVRMPDGAPARFGPFAYGHRYAIDAAVTEAARAIGCTPGLASWYADATDPWVTSDQEPATPATSGSFAESVLVDRAETPLYATNRLTLSFALADGSVDAAAEPELHVAADASSGAATVVLPSPVVVRRLRSRSLPGYDQAYAPTEGGRWHTLRPRAWYEDAAATGTPSLTVRSAVDGTLYALWRWNTADGVVDNRG